MGSIHSFIESVIDTSCCYPGDTNSGGPRGGLEANLPLVSISLPSELLQVEHTKVFFMGN